MSSKELKPIIFLIMLLIASSCGSANQQSALDVTNTIEQPTTIPTLCPTQDALFEDITLCSTTFAEARTLLETRYGADNITIDDRTIGWATNSVAVYSSGRIHINEQNIIDSIAFNFSEGQLTIAEFIDQMGEPPSIHIIYGCAALALFYPDMGMQVLPYPLNGSMDIAPTQSIQGLTFLPYEDGADWPVTDTQTIIWQGFIDYCSLLTPAASES